MTAPIPEPLVERMVALVRACVAQDNANRVDERWAEYESGPLFVEARAIAAELPSPVDPDLIEVRRLLADRDPNKGYQYLNGSRDDYPTTQDALTALKRGRALEREQGK